jgi:Gas vesicle protein
MAARPASRSRQPRAPAAADAPRTASEEILLDQDASLLDIVDNVLNKGVVLSGDVTIALAQVDLIYARLSLLLCAADRVLPNEHADFMERHHERHVLRELTKSRGADPLEPVRRRRGNPRPNGST